MDFAILQSCLNLSDVCSVASLPIESTPLFSSDGISTEWVLFPLQRRPLQQGDDSGLLLVAAHVAHGRQPWTTCRRRCTSELCSSRLRTAEPSTHETRGQACWSCPPPVALQPRGGADPSLNNQTCSLRAKPACCGFVRLALHISQPRYRLCTIFGASDQFGDMPQGIRTGIEPLRQEARLSGPALCQLLCNPAEEPTQAFITRHVRPGPRQLVVLWPALCSAFDYLASRAARACLGTVSAPLFWSFRPVRNYAPGQAYWNRDGIIIDQDSPFFRFAEGPRTSR